MTDEKTFKTLMSELIRQPIDRLQDATVLNDLVAESLMLVEMIIGLEEELGVRLNQEQLQHVKTVGDLKKLFVA